MSGRHKQVDGDTHNDNLPSQIMNCKLALYWTMAARAFTGVADGYTVEPPPVNIG